MRARVVLLVLCARHWADALSPAKPIVELKEELSDEQFPGGLWWLGKSADEIAMQKQREREELEATYVYIDGRAHCCDRHHSKVKVPTVEPLVRKRNVTAAVAVINLAKRQDRCKCMSSQLKASPYPVERFNAAVLHAKDAKDLQKHRDAGGKCERAFRRGVTCGAHNCLAEMSLFCSQFQLLNHLVDEHEEDYFIILEDDVLLDKYAWDKIGEFLETYPEPFDLVQVDSYGNQATPLHDIRHIFSGSYIYKPSENGDYWGGHCFIVRRAAVQQLLEKLEHLGGVPVDRLPKLLAHTDLNVIEAHLKVFRHADDPKMRLRILKSGEIPGCIPEVENSDLDFTKHGKFHKDARKPLKEEDDDDEPVGSSIHASLARKNSEDGPLMCAHSPIISVLSRT